MSKCNKIIGIIKRLSIILPRDASLTLCRMFIRSHLDYVGIIYEKNNNELFFKKIESVQYKICLAITGTIQDTSQENLHQEIRLEFLSDR